MSNSFNRVSLFRVNRSRRRNSSRIQQVPSGHMCRQLIYLHTEISRDNYHMYIQKAISVRVDVIKIHRSFEMIATLIE